jgi:hypothetical protein
MKKIYEKQPKIKPIVENFTITIVFITESGILKLHSGGEETVTVG